MELEEATSGSESERVVLIRHLRRRLVVYGREGALAPAEAASYQLLKEQIDEVLGTLTPRERRVLQLRFGLEDGRSRTLEEVGREFGVTRERIRQIEAKALRKLRHPTRSRHLRDYLG